VTAIERATVADWKNQSGGMAASWHFGGISAQGARPFLDEANVDVGAEFDERQSLGIGSSPNPDSDTPARYEYDRKTSYSCCSGIFVSFGYSRSQLFKILIDVVQANDVPLLQENRRTRQGLKVINRNTVREYHYRDSANPGGAPISAHT